MEYDKSWWIMAILPLGFQGPLTNRWQPPFQGTSQAVSYFEIVFSDSSDQGSMESDGDDDDGGGGDDDDDDYHY